VPPARREQEWTALRNPREYLLAVDAGELLQSIAVERRHARSVMRTCFLWKLFIIIWVVGQTFLSANAHGRLECLPHGGNSMAETIGKFQVLGELGKGAHSTIYHIRRLSDSRQFALKMVPIEDKEDAKFHEQAQLEFRV